MNYSERRTSNDFTIGTLEAARAYRAWGWSIFPISAAKRPLIKWKALQTEHAPMEALPFWFGAKHGRYAGSLIAIATGAFSNIFVLDADTEEAIEEVKSLGAPDTPTAKTRRGQHWYFQFNRDRVLRNGDHMGGSGKIDGRGEGGLIVAPPAENRRWIVSPHDTPLAPIPEWVYELYRLRKTSTTSPTLPLAEQIKDEARLPLSQVPKSFPSITSLSDEWQVRVDRIATEVARYTDRRHELYLGLSGELCWIAVTNDGRYASLEGNLIETVVEAVRTKAHPYWERDTGVRDTLDRILSQNLLPKGLHHSFPHLHHVVREALRIDRHVPVPVDSLEQATHDAKEWLYHLVCRTEQVEQETSRRQRAVDEAQRKVDTLVTQGEQALEQDDLVGFQQAKLDVKDANRHLRVALDFQAKPLTAHRNRNVFALAGECGFGKTYISCALAIYFAQRGVKVAIATASNERAISMCKENLLGKRSLQRFFGALSIEPMEEWDAKQARLKPEDRLDQSLTPLEACIHHKCAKSFVEGGQSLHRVYCLGGSKNQKLAEAKGTLCEHFDRCKVREGIEEVKIPGEPSMIAVGNFSTMKSLIQFAEGDGILIVDEPPSLIEAEEMTYDQAQTTLTHLGDFESLYTGYMYPTLRDVVAFRGPEYGNQTDPIQATEFFANLPIRVRDALPSTWHGSSPPVKKQVLSEIRSSLISRDKRYARARSVGTASRIFKLIYDTAKQIQDNQSETTTDVSAPSVPNDSENLFEGILPKRTRETPDTIGRSDTTLTSKATLRYIPNRDRDGQGNVVFTHLHRELEAALTRPVSFNTKTGAGGVTILLDANYRSNEKAYERLLGYAPECRRYTLLDAGAAHRTWVQTKASRNKLFEHGRPHIETISRLLRDTVLEWVRQGPSEKEYGFISFLPIILLIRRVQETIGGINPDGDPPEKWRPKDWGNLNELAAELQRTVGDELFRRIPITGYFHAVRGSNAYQSMYGIISFGDPRSNIGSCAHAAQWLDLTEEDGQKQVTIQCEDELEQDHGRLRSVRRVTESRSLHVGQVQPGGTGWNKIDVVASHVDGGRPKNEGDMPADEFAQAIETLGGPAAAIAIFIEHGVSIARTALFRFRNGERGIPQEIAEAVRKTVNNFRSFGRVPETPLIKREFG